MRDLVARPNAANKLLRARPRQPFERVLRLHGESADAFDRLVTDLEAVTRPAGPLRDELNALREIRDRARAGSDGAAAAIRAVGATDPRDPRVEAEMRRVIAG